MVVAIVLLFIVTTINVGFNWSYISSAFIDNGQSFWSNYSFLVFSENIFLGMGITGAINTILADSIMVCILDSFGTRPLLFGVDLALLDGLGTALACCPATYCISSLWNWCDAQVPFLFHAFS